MWSITKKLREGVNRTGQIEKQLEEIQRQAGGVQEYLAEARLLRTVQERSGSEFQKGCFMDCVTEASFMAEKLTGGLRRLVIEKCLGPGGIQMKASVRGEIQRGKICGKPLTGGEKRGRFRA